MLKDLHELHAKYYKRLTADYYKGIPCTLDEREDPMRCFEIFLVLEEYARRCQQMLSYDLSKILFFSYSMFVVF